MWLWSPHRRAGEHSVLRTAMRERAELGERWTHPAPFAKPRALGGSRRGNPGA